MRLTIKQAEEKILELQTKLGRAQTEASFYLQDIHKRLDTLKFNKRFPG